jgi:kynurenine formamidase
MRVKSLVVGYVLALALFLFAHRRPTVAEPAFHSVVDLTFPSTGPLPSGEKIGLNSGHTLTQSAHSHQFARAAAAGELFETRLDAPATLANGLWTVDQIPPERLIASLVVLDIRDSVMKNPDYQLSVIDIANWERSRGEIPPGSVVMALTGSAARNGSSSSDHFPHAAGYSPEAARFLIEGRKVVGLGIDSPSIDSSLSKDHPVYRYALSRSAYLLENVRDLDRAPAGGGVVMVAPPKLENRANAPVRILALAR